MQLQSNRRHPTKPREVKNKKRKQLTRELLRYAKDRSIKIPTSAKLKKTVHGGSSFLSPVLGSISRVATAGIV